MPSFVLPHLPPASLEITDSIRDLVLSARVQLAELNGYAHAVPDPMLLLSPWVIREAVASSEIENLNTTVLSALQNELVAEQSRDMPDKEVIRYRDALLWGYELMDRLPLTGRLLRGMHEKLMPEVGGNFRRTQNSIQNAVTGEVVYVPPPPQQVSEYIGQLELYINDRQVTVDPLVKIALAHYQFEAIHPFDDGNGRIGRMLIGLQLIHEEILKYPILYISGYINENRAEYYRGLRAVTEEGDWQRWLTYLLKGMRLQALKTKESVFAIMDYRAEFREQLRDRLPAIYSGDLVDLLFAQPVQSTVSLAEKLAVHRTTAYRYLQQLVEEDFMRALSEGGKQYYVNARLLTLLSG